MTVPDKEPYLPNVQQYTTWRELVEATVQKLQRAAGNSRASDADDYRTAEILILRRAQQYSFTEEFSLLRNGKPVQRNSHLLTLSAQLDKTDELIKVDGRLHRFEDIDPDAVHPIILDHRHPTTKLLIQDYNPRFCHPGPERVFVEIRRKFWILRGREAIRQYQHTCTDC